MYMQIYLTFVISYKFLVVFLFKNILLGNRKVFFNHLHILYFYCKVEEVIFILEWKNSIFIEK